MDQAHTPVPPPAGAAGSPPSCFAPSRPAPPARVSRQRRSADPARPAAERRPAPDGAAFTGLEPLEPRQLLSGDTLSILAFGDSLTLGIGSVDQSYRKHLGDRLDDAGIGFDFVGKLRDGNFADNQHYSVHGARARDSYTNAEGVYRKSLADALRDDSVLGRDEKPDVILLHIGTNSVYGVSAQRGLDELRTLLDEMARYWRDGRFAPDVRVLLAEIVPAGRGPNKTVGPDAVLRTAEYNRRLSEVVGALGDRGFAARVSRVDFFKVDAGAIGLGSADRAKADTDGDRYVDWFNTLDETNPRATATANHDLMRQNDYLHPAPLGYKVMGYTWFTALRDAGLLNPNSTPTPQPLPTPPPTPTPPPSPTPAPPASAPGVFENLPAGYTLAAQGDFDGDRDTDYLFRNVGTAGTLVRTAQEGRLAAEARLNNVDDGWFVRDVADFNNDGRDDIFWVSKARRAGTWLMNGTAAQLVIPRDTATLGTRFEQTRDVNGDGQRDIVWASPSGQVIWFLRNADLVRIEDRQNAAPAPAPNPSAPAPAPAPPAGSITPPPSGFVVTATGDFDGDGDGDQVLWNRDTQQTRVRLLQNGGVAGEFAGLNVSGNWRPDRVADLNRDGRADLTWVNHAGRVAHWFIGDRRVDLVLPNG